MRFIALILGSCHSVKLCAQIVKILPNAVAQAISRCFIILVIKNLYIYFLVLTANNTPNTIPNRAANKTRCSVGKRKVIV